MATQGAVTKSRIMATMPRNPNPYMGFRGNPDGHQGLALADYGVYAPPLQQALQGFGYRTKLLLPATNAAVKQIVRRGWPVVAWITYRLQRALPRIASANGVHFVLVPHEHAVLVVGYDDRTILANDPWTGKHVAYDWRDFDRSWGYFGNMALAVEPCPFPQAVTGVHVDDASSAVIDWSWNAGRNAVRYAVTIWQVGTSRTVVYRATQTARRARLSSLVAGTQYEISVRAVSRCGGQTAATRLWYQLPGIPPTPTPADALLTPTAAVTTTATP